MGTSTIIAIVVVVLLLAGAVLLALPMVRRQRLRGRFGSEYDRAVERHGDRAEAERELRDRERRHAELELRRLPAGARVAFTERWEAVQALFVDEPQRAVHQADELVGEVMAARGYPAVDDDERAALLSVEHGHTMDAYRSAHDTRNRAGADASTEHLREAMVQYRAMFVELLGASDESDSRDLGDSGDGMRGQARDDLRDDDPDGVDEVRDGSHDGTVAAGTGTPAAEGMPAHRRDAVEDAEMREARVDGTDHPRHVTR